MLFRDLFVLAFGLAAIAGCFAVVSATIQSLFARTPAGGASASAVGSTLTPDPVAPPPAPRVNSALVGPAGVVRHPPIVVTPGGVATTNTRDLDEALLDEALLRQGIDPVQFRRAKLEAAILRYGANLVSVDDMRPPVQGVPSEASVTPAQDAEFWEVEPAPRHDPTV